MNSKVIYTCLTGGYDDLLQPEVINNDFDYICFSNDIKEIQIGVWQIRQIPFETDDNTRLSRYSKLLPHKVLQEYEYSIYMDANIQIIGQEFYDIVNKKIEEGVLIAQVPHLNRDCVYEDIKIAYRYGKVDFKSAHRQYKYLQNNEFPKHYGLYENNIILRNHNVEKVVIISENWWKEFSKSAKRDQFSLTYVYWINNFKPVLLFWDTINARNAEFLNFVVKHKNETRKNILLRAFRKVYRIIIALFI
jgi:hypothetical protein